MSANVDQLIRDLARDAGPVKRLLPLRARFAIWLGFAGLYLVGGVLLLGIRPDLAEQLTSFSFLIQAVLSAATAVLSASSAFALSVPGAERPRWTRLAPLVVLVVWVAWMLYRMVSFVSDPAIWIMVISEYSLDEIGIGLSLASVPGVSLFLAVRRAAPLRPLWAGGFSLIAAGSLASLGGQLTCTSPCPIHAVVLHLTPMLAVGLLGVVAGALLLRRLR
jgi:hypothetical protein